MCFISIVAAVGATLGAVFPFFFYIDFYRGREAKGCCSCVLKVRALFEDCANDALSGKELVEAIDA
ncbi:MAG: hypothetical protein ACLTSM_05090 [Eubacterium sp.]